MILNLPHGTLHLPVFLPDATLGVVRAVDDVDVYIEQPCRTYEECLSVRRHTNHPFVLDENIVSHQREQR